EECSRESKLALRAADNDVVVLSVVLAGGGRDRDRNYERSALGEARKVDGGGCCGKDENAVFSAEMDIRNGPGKAVGTGAWCGTKGVAGWMRRRMARGSVSVGVHTHKHGKVVVRGVMRGGRATRAAADSGPVNRRTSGRVG